jgi:hypothetical protein
MRDQSSGWCRRAISLCLLLGLVFEFTWQPSQAADPEDPDWPCIQRKVPTISAAAMWAGPPVEELADQWRDDPEITALAEEITARRTDLEKGKKAIAALAGRLEVDKDRKLTMLFAAALNRINRDRGSIIAGIQRYARRQAALAELIAQQTMEINRLIRDDDQAQQARLDELQEKQNWDTRIYEERERSLTYICQQPIILEQRIFALAREIMAHLD